MLFSTSTLALVAGFANLFSVANAQCINNVAVYNPNVRTMTSNNSWFIVPISSTAVQSAIDQSNPTAGLKLLPVPNDPTLFSQPFPAGMHPVLVIQGLNDDIRMSALQIDGPLATSDLYVPYVSQGGSQTPLSAALNGYIAGPNGPLPNGLVPAVASTLLFAGNPERLGQFIPEDAAYQGDSGGTLSQSSKWALVPNPVSGPGVYPNVADMEFKISSRQSPKYTDLGIKTMINMPFVLPSGMCQRNTYYFTNATALQRSVSGIVTLGPGAAGTDVTGGVISGVYSGVDGIVACAQNVGNSPQNCEDAAKSVDPAGLK